MRRTGYFDVSVHRAHTNNVGTLGTITSKCMETWDYRHCVNVQKLGNVFMFDINRAWPVSMFRGSEHISGMGTCFGDGKIHVSLSIGTRQVA
jgi:hypothetical protein